SEMSAGRGRYGGGWKRRQTLGFKSPWAAQPFGGEGDNVRRPLVEYFQEARREGSGAGGDAGPRRGGRRAAAAARRHGAKLSAVGVQTGRELKGIEVDFAKRLRSALNRKGEIVETEWEEVGPRGTIIDPPRPAPRHR